MPVLVDDDLLFEDGPGAPRPWVAVNQWLRELPASGCPAPGSWESYARVVREWAEFLGVHGVGLFDSRDRLMLANWTPRASTGRPTSAPVSATGRPPTPRQSARPTPSSVTIRTGAATDARDLQDDPPGIWFMFSDGSTAQFGLGRLPCPGLAADLLTGLAELVHPHGSIDAAGSVNRYILAFREMARRLSAAGVHRKRR
jgi:hypothetical protein